jgi:hypothetical protein
MNDEKVTLQLNSHLFGSLKADFSAVKSHFKRTHHVLELLSWKTRFLLLGGRGGAKGFGGGLLNWQVNPKILQPLTWLYKVCIFMVNRHLIVALGKKLSNNIFLYAAFGS